MNQNDIATLRRKYDFKERGIKYEDYKLHKYGINYNNFIKLHTELIDRDLKIIKDNGLFILFYLIGKAKNKEFIKTTLALIKDDVLISEYKITEGLKLLHTNGLINIKEGIKNINKNKPLNIMILYEYKYNEGSKGFKAVPIDYINLIMPKLEESVDLSILMILILRFRYIFPTNTTNYETGEVIYSTPVLEYAFPTLEQIGNIICNKDRKTIKEGIKRLSVLKLVSYKAGREFSTGTIQGEINNPNYIYRVQLLQRVEYMYYNYYILPDKYENEHKNNMRQKFLKQLESIGYEDISKSELNINLLDKDYIRHTYQQEMEKYNNSLTENIKYIDGTIIDNFNNENIPKPEDRKVDS